jgi:hypothetical protein
VDTVPGVTVFIHSSQVDLAWVSGEEVSPSDHGIFVLIQDEILAAIGQVLGYV